MANGQRSDEKIEISRQQHLYAAAVLTFMGFFGALAKPILNWGEFWFASVILTLAAALGVFVVVKWHAEYCKRNELDMRWREALSHSLDERKGAFLCCSLISLGWVGIIGTFLFGALAR